MARNKHEDSSSLEDQNNTLKSTSSKAGENSHPMRKPLMDWEQPEFDELDLCMEVTTYIYHWQ